MLSAIGGRWAASGVALLVLLILAGREGAAAEPVVVQVEGRAAADPEQPLAARDPAISDAIVEAALEVARQAIRSPLPDEEADRLRQELAPVAPELLLTYRLESGGEVRRSRDDPGGVEYVVRLRATVDAARVRRELSRLGHLAEAGSRPSLLLRVRNKRRAWSGGEDPRLGPLERAVREDLAAHGFIVLDAGVLPGPDPESRSALDLARSAGADVGVEIEADLRPTRAGSRLSGVIAEISVVARRAGDGFELARMRLDTPAYHSDPDEASMRALDASQEPLARNLRVQLERNWAALAGDRRPITLVLRGVGGFAQVKAVLGLLQQGAGVEGVELRSVGSGSAEFELRDSPAPAALQARLTQSELEGFQLESVLITADRLELRVRSHTPGERRRDPRSAGPPHSIPN